MMYFWFWGCDGYTPVEFTFFRLDSLNQSHSLMRIFGSTGPTSEGHTSPPDARASGWFCVLTAVAPGLSESSLRRRKMVTPMSTIVDKRSATTAPPETCFDFFTIDLLLGCPHLEDKIYYHK